MLPQTSLAGFFIFISVSSFLKTGDILHPGFCWGLIEKTQIRPYTGLPTCDPCLPANSRYNLPDGSCFILDDHFKEPLPYYWALDRNLNSCGVPAPSCPKQLLSSAKFWFFVLLIWKACALGGRGSGFTSVEPVVLPSLGLTDVSSGGRGDGWRRHSDFLTCLVPEVFFTQDNLEFIASAVAAGEVIRTF